MSVPSTPSPPLIVEVMGELRIRVGDDARPLPRSRKARALLAYLAITGRQHRRDVLCDLLWDVADDRRAALRWSLSKLRKTLGERSADHLVATRDHVELALPPACLDLTGLRRAVRHDLETAPIEELRALCGAIRGEVLEGMLLPDFDAFEAWLEAERAEARGHFTRLGRALVQRLEADPASALPHARAWLHRTGSEEARRWVDQLSDAVGHAPPTSPTSAATPSLAEPLSPAPLDRAPASPLFGRAREMERLRAAADAVRRTREGRLVLLLAEPGMGKTRLLEELRDVLRAERPWLLDGVFYEAERNRPLAPFLDATRDALAEPIVDAPSALEREELFETLAAHVRRGADARGLGLLFLDDAHLCDPSSSELVHYLVRTAARTPLLTVLACRPAELEDNPALSRALLALRRRHPVEEIALAPLDAAAMRALVHAEQADAPIERVLDDSAGNPLLALELVRAGDDGGAVPRTFADLVLARVASLSEDARAVVRWAAIFERGPLSALEAACADEISDFVAAFETASRYRLVRLERSNEPTGGFSMAHALVRRVVYEATSPVRRAAMHRRAAEVLGEGRPRSDRTSLVAYHATRADRPDLAASALVRGAEHCAAMGAIGDAAELADRALALLDALEPSHALSIELEALLVLEQVRRAEPTDGSADRLTELGMRALDEGRAEDARRAFDAASRKRWSAGSNRDGYGLARRAWQASRGGDADQRMRGQSLLAMCLVLMEKQLPEAQAIVQEAEALGRGAASTEPTELALARGLLHRHAGRLEEARRDAADARTLSRLARSSLREAAALELTLQVELLADRPERARDAATALAELSARMREGAEAALALAGLALARESLEDARAELTEATTQLRALDDKRRLAWVANRWAAREREAGESDRARALATTALEAALAVEAQSEAALAACELMAAAADDAEAYGRAEEVLAELEATGTLSHEARARIEQLTGAPGGRAVKGAETWSS